MARKSISKRTRFEVFKRDRFTCQYCGGKPPEVVLHLDHIVPVAKRGSNDSSNLVTSCQDCNLGKSDVSLGDVRPAPTADTLAQMTEGREQLAAYQDYLMSERKQREAEAVLIGRELYSKLDVEVSDRMLVDIRTMLKDLPLPEVLDAVDITLARDLYRYPGWKYFCGVCWTKIKAARNRISTYEQAMNRRQGDAN